MRYFPTILLVLLATVLGGLAIIHTGGRYHTAIFGVPPTEPGELLFDAKELDKVKVITLTDSDGNKIVFKQDGHIWVSTMPWKDRVDPLYIRALFQFTTNLKVQEVIPRDGLELKEFGLRAGHTRVTMTDFKGQILCDYRIGRPAAWQIPIKDKKETQPTTYIRLAQRDLKDNVYLCSLDAGSLIHPLFVQEFARFRDHHPFNFSPRYLDKVSIQSPEGEVVVSRPNLQSPWKITKPDELRIDPEALNQLFLNIARLTAIKVEDRASVTLPTAGDASNQEEKVKIRFAGIEDDIILNVYPPAAEEDKTALATVSDRPDTVFHLPLTQSISGTTSLAQLETGVNDLRSKTMTHLNGPQLKTIIIRPLGRPDILLTRTPKTTWQILRKSGYEAANEDTIIDLMLAVTRDKVAKFVTDAATDLKPYGLDRPLLQIGFISFDGQAMRIAISRNKTDENIYAHIVGKPNIWQLSNETMGKISIHPWQWRTEHVWHIPKVDATQIDIERNNAPAVQLNCNYFTDQWTAQIDGANATASLNPNRAKKLLSNLEALKTTKWLGPFYSQAAKALDTPDTVIRIHLNRFADDSTELPPIVKTLKIAHTPGKLIYFAKIDNLPVTPENEGEERFFLLSPDDVNKLYVHLFE